MYGGQETHCLVLSKLSSYKEILCLVGILGEYPMTVKLWVWLRNGAEKEVVAVSSKEAMWLKKNLYLYLHYYSVPGAGLGLHMYYFSYVL